MKLPSRYVVETFSLALLAVTGAWTAGCGESPPASSTATQSALDNSYDPHMHVVYVESNDPTSAGSNAILAYQRADDGSLTPLPGSPFATGGRGVGDPTQGLGPLDSDQNVVLSRDHHLLFAVNAGSNSIAVFRIHHDGTLTAVPGSPFPSGGINPVSVGMAGGRLYVVNKDGDPAQVIAGSLPSYTAFDIGDDGRLSPIRGATVSAPAGSSPSQALISPSGRVLFDAQFLGGRLQSFRIADDGHLIEAPGSPQALPAVVPAPALPLGLAVHPTLPILYANFVTASQLGVYFYDEGSGQLDFAQESANSGKAPCWVRVNQAASGLYVVNTGDPSVSFFTLADPFTPVEAQRLVLHGPGSAFQEELDPAGNFLYVVSQRTTMDVNDPTGNTLHVVQVAADGTLSEAPSSPLSLPVPPTARPQGIAVL